MDLTGEVKTEPQLPKYAAGQKKSAFDADNIFFLSTFTHEGTIILPWHCVTVSGTGNVPDSAKYQQTVKMSCIQRLTPMTGR